MLGAAVRNVDSDRARNLQACLRSLARQTLPRDCYRIVLVEQDVTSKLGDLCAGLVDDYRFAYSPKPLNRSWLLNIGGLAARHGVVCTFDADLIVPADFLRMGLLAWQSGALALRPFTEILYMNPQSTQLAQERIARGEIVDCDSADYDGDIHPWSKGGCIWIDAALYRRMGGHDERFEGWGLEDREFWDRLEQQTRIFTLPGRLLHMYHERSFEKHPEVRESAVLYHALQRKLLPAQRGPVGDPFRFAKDIHQGRAENRAVASCAPSDVVSTLSQVVSNTHAHSAPSFDDETLHEAREVLRARLADARDTPGPTFATNPRTSGVQRSAESLFVRGRLAATAGQHGVARSCLTACARFDRTNVHYLAHLSVALVRDGRTAQALAAALRAVSLAPLQTDPYRALGLALREAGLTAAAVGVAQEAMLLDLTNATLVLGVADAFRADGRRQAAMLAYELAARLAPDDAVAHLRLGEGHLANGDPESALTAFSRARNAISAGFSSPPETPTPPAGAMARPSSRNTEQAARHRVLLPATRDNFDVPQPSTLLRDARHGRAESLHRLHRMDEAVHELELIPPAQASVASRLLLAQALEASGRSADAVSVRAALGLALAATGRVAEATEAFESALARKPDCLKALLGLADLHAAHGRYEEAAAFFARASAVDPAHVRSRIDQGRVAYSLGEIDRGWEAFAAFDEPALEEHREFEQPRWDGGPLQGRTLLVQVEHTYGDAIQSLRYLPFLQVTGARLIVQCPSRLLPLIRRCADVELVVAEAAPLPGFDVTVQLLQVPVIVQSARWPVPPSPSDFRADERLMAHWKKRLLATRAQAHDEACVTVGLSWAGHPEGINAKARFTHLDTFAPLGDVAGARFISLQMGPQTVDLLAPPPGLVIEHLQDDGCSMDDTAALMASLDVVVTVDTGVAHLAAALGRTTWLLLPFVADWRWMQETERTPLYPSIRIFRQRTPGDWAEVLTRVREALEALVADRHARMGLSDLVQTGRPADGNR